MIAEFPYFDSASSRARQAGRIKDYKRLIQVFIFGSHAKRDPSVTSFKTETEDKVELQIMKRITTSLVVLISLGGAGYALAQDTEPTSAVEASGQQDRSGKRFNRGPIDLEQFSRMESMKAADTNGDGTLDREEIEAHALNQMVKRMADRMERRLDIDGDGTVTLAEIEAHKTKQFAALDRNDDGQLDRRELRASKMDRSFGKRGAHHGRHWAHRHR